MAYEIERCSKCNKYKVIFKEDEARPVDLMNRKQAIEKCSCDDIGGLSNA